MGSLTAGAMVCDASLLPSTALWGFICLFVCFLKGAKEYTVLYIYNLNANYRPVTPVLSGVFCSAHSAGLP